MYYIKIMLSFIMLLAILVITTEGRNKKVVIHVPYKVKKIRHTHTVYKTIHHHHTHHEPHVDHEEHEHFHHMHIHDEPPSGQHSQPVPGIGIPEFLPDLPDSALDIPDVPSHEYPVLPGRHIAHVPLYRRN
ncbi:uncharacterized histidine-rich protein DDB_G0274557-like [Trichoplusia ni]|uniref:Uncharacterized histidine-rich protein DDB_G0274557-like n=1 Tax=Trichoplusia ni TaxID=7111 RepID=A0A7E5VHH1_TRINI|nr:uncharacterized histidine-rich protein DDB_G0274557-like [Trichoplusia ni]